MNQQDYSTCKIQPLKDSASSDNAPKQSSQRSSQNPEQGIVFSKLYDVNFQVFVQTRGRQFVSLNM